MRCPECGEPIPEIAERCPFCAADLAIPETASVHLVSAGPNLIGVIKVLRGALGVGLAEAKRLAEGAPCRLAVGISQAKASELCANLAAAGAKAEVRILSAPPPPTADLTYSLVLKGAGRNQIAVIKVIREITGLGLLEAKRLSESPPGRLKEHLSRGTAEELVAQLTACGAGAELEIEPEPPPPEAALHYEAVLVRSGDLIPTVKAVRDVLGLGLMEAKRLAENPPQIIGKGLNRDRAEYIRSQFAQAGASVEVRTTG